MIETCRR